MNRIALHRGTIGVLVIGFVLPATAGCRGRAQEDLYAQKLRQEVRVLEDQLYEADYENRVLIDKLRRAKASQHKAADQSSDVIHERVHQASPLKSDESRGDAHPSKPFDMGHDLDSPPLTDPFRPRGSGTLTPPGNDSAEVPEMVPPGKPQQTSEASSENRGPEDDDDSVLPLPKRDSRPNSDSFELPDIDSLIDEGQLVDPADIGTPSMPESSRAPGPSLMPGPPQVPEPPGAGDQRLDPIEQGKPLPPNSINGRPDGPPGKIVMPPGLGMLGGLGAVAGSSPKVILKVARIDIEPHATQPRFGRREDDDPANANTLICEGIDVVIAGHDQYGQPIGFHPKAIDPASRLASQDLPQTRPIDQQDPIEGISVVVLDPNRSGDDVRLGRWDFDADMLDQIQRRSPEPHRLRLPIRWQEKQPLASEVVVFARYAAGERDLRCEAKVRLTAQPSVAGWLPRK
ncbi:MAG: hypothetical protein AAF539_12005 [Planctomycetota bacterium]